jgi:cytochrome P450/NADPH-cytochrome P450 reductase
MSSNKGSLPIPQPPAKFLLGNLHDIDPANAPASMWRLADLYGEIFRLDLAGNKIVVCSTHELVNDLCDASRFEKPVGAVLKEVRVLTKDGLFTAYPGEHVSNTFIKHAVAFDTSRIELGCCSPSLDACIWSHWNPKG